MKEKILHFIFCEERHNPLDNAEPFVYEMIRTNIPFFFVTSVTTFAIFLNKFADSQLITVWVHHQANTHEIDTFKRYHGETLGADIINKFPQLKFKYITRAPNHPAKSNDRKKSDIISLEEIFDEIKKSENHQKIADFFDVEEYKNSIDMTKKIISPGHTNITVGDHCVVSIGDKNDISNKVIIKNNIEYLAKELEKIHVPKSDIEELKSILKTDQPDYENNKFGNKTNNWIQKMIGKALDGTWHVGIEAAGNLLAQLLMSYYGI